MTIDEAIKHCEEVAIKKIQESNSSDKEESEKCLQCAKEHEQLAKWLQELKTYKNDEKFGEIKKRLPIAELEKSISDLDLKYGDLIYQHKDGSRYRVLGGTVINKDRKAWYGLIYSPVGYPTIVHTRPLYEFLDGRFTLVE